MKRLRVLSRSYIFLLLVFFVFADASAVWGQPSSPPRIGAGFRGLVSPRTALSQGSGGGLPRLSQIRHASSLKVSFSNRGALRRGVIRGIIFSNEEVFFEGCVGAESRPSSQPAGSASRPVLPLELHARLNGVFLSIDKKAFRLRASFELLEFKQIADYVSSPFNGVVTIPTGKRRDWEVKPTSVCKALHKTMQVRFPQYHPAFLQATRLSKALVDMDLLPKTPLALYRLRRLLDLFKRPQRNAEDSESPTRDLPPNVGSALHRITSWAIHNLEKKGGLKATCSNGTAKLYGLPLFTFEEEKTRKNGPDIYSELKQVSLWFTENQQRLLCEKIGTSVVCPSVYKRFLELYRVQTLFRFVASNNPIGWATFRGGLESLLEPKSDPKTVPWYHARVKPEDRMWLDAFLATCVVKANLREPE